MSGTHPQFHQRRTIRLQGYDYSQEGLYFITICCKRRGYNVRYPFGNIENGEMKLNQCGQIAFDEWVKLSERFSNFELDVFQIMPDHIHGIISLYNVGAGFTPAQYMGDMVSPIDMDTRATARVAPTTVDHMVDFTGVNMGVNTVGNIIGAYKSLVANGCLDIYKSKNETMGKLWQRNYHEHIIRNEQSYHTISEYILNNPAKWPNDRFYH